MRVARGILGAVALATCGLAAAQDMMTAPPATPGGPPPGAGLPPRAPSGADGVTAARHQGFFIRPDLGYGYLSMTTPSPSGDVTVSGGAGFFGVAVGGTVSEHLVLAVHLYDAVMTDPTASQGNLSSSTRNTTVGMIGFGPLLTYYFAPSNVYLAGTLAVTRLSSEVSGTRTDSQTGLGARLSAGKEWWVSDHWGLGLAGQLVFSSNQDSGSNAPTITTLGLGLSFSATFN